MESKYEETIDKDDDKLSLFGSKGADDKDPSAKTDLNNSQILAEVQEYFYANDALAAEFERFVSERASVFASADLSEYKLEYTNVYNEYKLLFETRLEGFITSLGVSVLQFFEILEEATLRDKDGSDALFGQMLLAVTEFDVFMQMMREGASTQTPYDHHAAGKYDGSPSSGSK
jgi:gamma-glutamyltranspeptidase